MVTMNGRVALTRDGAISTTPNGTPVANCGAADNVLVNKDSGEKVAVFYELVAWREAAEILAGFKKGEVVDITGTLMPKPWTDKSGHQRISLQITLTSIAKYVKDSSASAASGTKPATGKPASAAASSKPATSAASATPAASAAAGKTASNFVQIPDDDELPF